MTQKYDPKAVFGTNDILTTNKRIVSELDLNVSIPAASAASALAIGYPMAYNESTGKHAPWMAPDPTVFVVDIASRTGGTWGMTINSLVYANTIFAWNITAAALTEALRKDGFNVTVDLTSKVYTLTFDDEAQIKVIPSTLTGDVTQLSGGTADATATATAGTSTYGTHHIRGFINPNVMQSGIQTGALALVVLTGTDTVCTATQATPHNLVSGLTTVVVSGATESNLNKTATITVTTPYSFTYPVTAVTGGTVDSGVYTTTNDLMTMIMVKGEIHASLPQSLVAVGDVTALNTALKNDLVEKGIIVQGLAGTF